MTRPVIDYTSDPRVTTKKNADGAGWFVQAHAGMFQYQLHYCFTLWGARRKAKRELAWLLRRIQRKDDRAVETIRPAEG